MRVVVTGASGHIGGAITQHLLASQAEVIGITRSPDPGKSSELLWVRDNITDPLFIDRVSGRIQNCNAVVHCAAVLEDDIRCMDLSRVNCVGTHHVLLLAQRLGADYFVYMSSLSILGQPQIHPIDENHPICPLSAYAASKLYGERLVLDAQSSRFATVALRVSSPVGPGLQYRRIFRIFIENALTNLPIFIHGKGTRCQDYVDVRDIARSVKLCLDRKPTGIIHVGSGHPVPNVELARACVQQLNSKSIVVLGKMPANDDDVCWDLNVEKARKLLGFMPQYSLRDSIRDLASEIRQLNNSQV